MCRTCCLSCPMCLEIEKSICRRQGNHDDQSVGSFCWLHYGHSSRWPECRIHLNKQRLKMWFWVRSKFKYLPQTLIFPKVNDFSITSVKQHKKCLDDTFERFFTSSKKCTVFENHPKSRILISELRQCPPILAYWNWPVVGNAVNVNLARFARNVQCDFLGEFQTLCKW